MKTKKRVKFEAYLKYSLVIFSALLFECLLFLFCAWLFSHGSSAAFNAGVATIFGMTGVVYGIYILLKDMKTELDLIDKKFKSDSNNKVKVEG